MRRLFALSVLALAALIGTASAANVGTRRVLTESAWPPTPELTVDCANNNLPPLTVTRASTAWEDNSAGVWSAFTSGVLRRTNRGCLVEGARTNIVRFSRDVTNAAWTKSASMTVALDQVGILNDANSASSLMAGAANQTATITTTVSSSTRAQSMFVKRITGTGVINLSMDNGATKTAVTPCPSTTFIGDPRCRVTIPTQTLANPTVFIEIVTSGDKIVVDAVQNETSTFSLSPILTTSVAVTRAADVVVVTSPPSFIGGVSLFAKGFPGPMVNATNQFPVTLSDGSTNNRVGILRNGTDGSQQSLVTLAGSGSFCNPPLAIPWANNTSNAMALSSNNFNQVTGRRGFATNTCAFKTPTSSVFNRIGIGDGGSGGSQFDGYISSILLFDSLTPKQLKSLLNNF